MIKLTNKLMLTLLLAVPVMSVASESGCLAKIMYAESRGESVEGVIAVGEAVRNRSKRTGIGICRLRGVKSMPLPSKLLFHYKALAKSVLSSSYSTVKKADSWNTGKRPRSAGSVTRRIGSHVFYVMADM